MLYGVGNHDLGKESMTTAISEENENSPVYKKYFPQHFPSNVDSDGTETGVERRVPEMHERRTFTAHTFADKMLVLSLDAHYGEPHGPRQSNWIERKLREYAGLRYSFTHYHNPLVPGCQKGIGSSMDAGRKYWIPLFDEYGLTMSFENHVHAMKRSFPLKNYTKSEGGTVYIGDGRWGTHKTFCDRVLDDLVPVSTLDFHAWFLRIRNTSIYVEALGLHGTVLDSFTVTK